MKAASYRRTAVKDEESNEALARQQVAVEAYARSQGIELVADFRDEGIGGHIPLEQRPSGARLLRGIQAREFEMVLVPSFDRLGRAEGVMDAALSQMIAAGAAVVSATEGLSR